MPRNADVYIDDYRIEDGDDVYAVLLPINNLNYLSSNTFITGEPNYQTRIYELDKDSLEIDSNYNIRVNEGGVDCSTVAGSNTISQTSHGLSAGTRVYFKNLGNAGLTAGIPYYVMPSPGVSEYQVEVVQGSGTPVSINQTLSGGTAIATTARSINDTSIGIVPSASQISDTTETQINDLYTSWGDGGDLKDLLQTTLDATRPIVTLWNADVSMLSLYAGDDYNASDGTQIDIQVSVPGINLSSASVFFGAVHQTNNTALKKEMSLVQVDSNWFARLQFTSSETSLPSGDYDMDVRIRTTDGRKLTVIRGIMRIYGTLASA